jgi:hypothetical protein
LPLTKLAAALGAVDWPKSVATLLADTDAAQTLASTNLRLAVWARQLESADHGNPALSFVREMQIAGQHVTVLIALALYKPAAASIRTVLETALYYSYFRTHPAELRTLARAEGFYLEKREILEFHKRHTVCFSELQQKLGVLSRLDAWYGPMSSLVHGQIPGTWIEHTSLADIKPIKATQDLAVNAFVEGEAIVHRFLLCTVARDLWDSFSSQGKKQLLAGLHGEAKKALQLDSA